MILIRWIYGLILCIVSVCVALEQSGPHCIPQALTTVSGISERSIPLKGPGLVVEYVEPRLTTASTISTATVTVYSTSLPQSPSQVSDKKITPLLQQILAPVVFVYNIIRSIVSRIFRIIAFLISPFIKTASLLLNMLVFRPLVLMQYLLTALYPVFFFLTIAMVTGICFGAVGGWFSEVILGILSKSKRPQVKSPELNYSHTADKFQMQYPVDSEVEDGWYEDEDIE